MALSKIKSDSIDSIDAAKIPNLDANKITTGTVDNARITLDATEIPNLDAAKITSGDIALARLGNAPATDLTPVRQDIAMLALYNAVSDNRAAYNLPFSFIDQFEDDTGITTQTDVSNVDEYFASVYSVSGAFASDANTKLLMHMDDSGLTTDSGNTGHTITNTSVVRSSTQSKYGGYSAYFNGSSWLTAPNHADWSFGTGDFTIEFWFYTGSPSSHMGFVDMNKYSHGFPVINCSSSTIGPQYASGSWITTPVPTSTWKHIAVGRDSGTTRLYADGVQANSGADTTNYSSSNGISIGSYYSTGYNLTGYIDELRISNVARYPSGTTFTPQVTAAISATGTLISDTQTAPSAITKMSGVILLKDGGSSTTTLGTHLTISFSATNGTGDDWVNAASYTAVTAPFSTGVTMIKLGETTVPSGASPTIRAVWASQTSGGYESQLHGWAMNY